MELPSIDPRGREDLLRELARRSETIADWKFRPGSGELGSVLGELYARMLADTVSRLNRTPEKHRLAFLNCRQTVRLAAHPAETPVAFTVAKGYENPVEIPSGTVLSAQTDNEPVVFRTVGHLTAIPGQLTDLVLADSRADFSCDIARDGAEFEPLKLRAPEEARRGRHLLALTFADALRSVNGRVRFWLRCLVLDGDRPMETGVLTDPLRFAWSVRSPEGAAYPLTAKVDAPDGGALLLEGGCGFEGAASSLCLELLDGALTGLALRGLHIWSLANGLPADTVVCGEHELDPESFSPFGSPMRAYEECLLFCNGALEMRGAEVTVTFDVTLGLHEEKLPENPEEIDYKWIMRKPSEKPPPPVSEVRAAVVDWEYWNGKAFCALPCKGSVNSRLLLGAESEQARMTFVLPDDIEPVEAGGRVGCFLRLCWNGDDALYRVPRAVYSPRIEHLRFSFCYLQPLYPTSAVAENHADRLELSTEGELRPFRPLPCRGMALLLGFDSLPSGIRMQLFFHLQNDDPGQAPAECALIGEGGGRLVSDDYTEGFAHSGLFSIMLPERVEKAVLFGRERCWLRISVDDRMVSPVLLDIRMNAQRVRNSIRCKEEFPISRLSSENRLRLAHGEIVWAVVLVLRENSGSWERWREYPVHGDTFTEGYYKLERLDGGLDFPGQIRAVTGGQQDAYVIRVIYETCDGARANLPAGALDRMREEIPFIASVVNPLPVVDGMGCETDEQLARRAEHLLYCGGRAVTARDYELLALDLCPMARRVRCRGGRPVELAVLPDRRSWGVSFAWLRADLKRKLAAVDCGELAGAGLHIFRAAVVPLRCEGAFSCPPGELHGVSERLERLQAALVAFLDPLTGGSKGDGWEIGTLPSRQQLASFLAAREPKWALLRLRVTARGGGLSGELEAFVPEWYHVPSPETICLEVEAC